MGMEPFGFLGMFFGLISIIIGVAWFVCCIVLFFKVWGMTNNIKALKKDYFFETEIECKDEMIKYLKKRWSV